MNSGDEAASSDFDIGFILPISLLLGGFSAVILGAGLTIASHVMLSAQYKVTVRVSKEITAIRNLIANIPTITTTPSIKQNVIVSRKIDAALNDVIERLINESILPWYSQLVDDVTPCVDTLRNVLLRAVGILSERASNMDQVGFFTDGIVTCFTRHLESIRVAQAAGEARGERGVFNLVPQLSSPERERNYLRLVSEFLLLRSLPEEYSRCVPLRTLLKELLACQIFEPAIARICDPDWINAQLLSYLRQQQAAEELHRRTYMYAASYEDFISLIHGSVDAHDLEHLRRNIINEIMQATAITNLKKAKGLDPSRESVPQGSGKGDLLQARNLKRYINQLTYAKALCERRINLVKSGKFDMTKDENGDGEVFFQTLQNLPGSKILMFNVILESPFARRYFSIYLDEIGCGALLGFWAAVQELRSSEKHLHHQLGTEIFYTFLNQHSPSVKVDKLTLRGVESFLLGNRGPEVLYEMAEEVERTLEERHYTGFLVSSTYHAMLTQATLQGVDFASEQLDEGNINASSEASVTNCESTHQQHPQLQLSVHSTFARNRLAQLHERLTNKLLALQAMQQNHKADPRVINNLEREIVCLRRDHQQLEAHMERTALWYDNIGAWKVTVQNVQMPEDRDHQPQLVLIVHMLGTPTASCHDLSLGCHVGLRGEDWVVTRPLVQVADLHRKLCQLSPTLKSQEIPSAPSKILFSKPVEDKSYLERTRLLAQTYFAAVMCDEKLAGSEFVYAFLSPSPEHLKQVAIQPKKFKFSFSTLFRGSDPKLDVPYEDDQLTGLGSDVSDSTSDGGGDAIAEPLFAFLEEVCDLRGASKWLRKTLVSFVQVTYGKNISRHIRETVSGLVSESMILYYVNGIRDYMWPSQEMPDVAVTLTSEDKIRIRQEAQDQFVNNVPVLLFTLVGQQNARQGAIKLFTILQHHALNKNLVHNILEVLLKEMFPELQEYLDCKKH